MKVLLIAAALVLGLAACQQNQQPAPAAKTEKVEKVEKVEAAPAKPTLNVGVVDLNKVFTESKSAKAGMATLEKVKERFDAKLGEMGESKAAPEGQNPEAMKQLGEVLNSYQQEMNDERERLMNVLNEGLQKALDNLRAKKNLAVILPREAALAFAPEVDVTQAAMDELDALGLDLTAAAAAAAPAPQAAAPAPQAAPAAPAKQ